MGHRAWSMEYKSFEIVNAETCWSEAEIPSEATCQGVALAKTEAAAGNTETRNLKPQ